MNDSQNRTCEIKGTLRFAEEKDTALICRTITRHNAAIYEHLGFEIILEDQDANLDSYTAFMLCRAENN